MAANTGASDSTGRKNYYNIAYGMLATNSKEAPEGFEEINQSEIKARYEKNENVDLRQRYYVKADGGKYPVKVFYSSIDGQVIGVEKVKNDKSTNLNVTIHDRDGDESILQTKFYGKVASDFLNRLLNINPEAEYNLRPYSIPSEAEIAGVKRKFYNQGVSIKDGNGTKVDRAFNKDNGLPGTAQVTNQEGTEVTSRVDQVNFLWERVQAKFANVNQANGIGEAPAANNAAPAQPAPQQQSPAPQQQAPTASAPKPGGLPF